MILMVIGTHFDLTDKNNNASFYRIRHTLSLVSQRVLSDFKRY